MAQVRVTGNLRRFFGGMAEGELEVDAPTVAEVIRAIDGRFPGFADYIVDERGALRQHVNVFVDGAPVRDRQGLTDPVEKQTRVFIVQALSGG